MHATNDNDLMGAFDESIQPTGEPTVGFLHPGAMGSAMAATCQAPKLWVKQGRSAATAIRAGAAGLEAVDSVEELTEAVDIIVSICPPHAAADVASLVASTGFDGLYVDANAVSPDTARLVASNFERFVDGSVIGPPPTEPGLARLYLSGPEAAEVAQIWTGSALEPIVLGSDPASASALKMAYAGWTKGSAALLLSCLALAEAEGVGSALRSEWDISQPGLTTRADRTASGVGPKGWRFVAEMNEIAQTMEAAGLTDGFHLGAAESYKRLAGLRHSTEPSLDTVLDLLINPHRSTSIQTGGEQSTGQAGS